MSGAGSGPGGAIDLARMTQVAHQDLRTRVRLRLPYGIPGVQGSYRIATPGIMWQASFSPEYLKPSLVVSQLEGASAEYDSDGHVVGIRSGNTGHRAPPTPIISLNPDRWGRSWRTLVELYADSFLDPGLDDQPTQLDVMAERVIRPCCVCLNRVLDALAFVGGTQNLPSLSPADFWSVDVSYVGPAGYVGGFSVSKLQTVWWGPRTARMYSAESEFRAVLADPAGLPMPSELLITAARKSLNGDYRGAVVDSVCAVEAALGAYLDEHLTKRGISKRKREEFLGPSGPGLSMRVAVLLPLLHEIEFPSDLLHDFAAANTKRNGIVHRGERANQMDADHAQTACRRLVACLRGYSRVPEHFDGQSFRRPGSSA